MSTQYTGYWGLFHALCRYCARHGTLKSITSGSSSHNGLPRSLRLLRKDWAEFKKKKSQSFPNPLNNVSTIFLSRPLDNGVVAQKIGHPLSANSNNILSPILYQVPWGMSSLIESHFSQNQDQWMTIVIFQIFLHTKIRVERLPDILLCLLFHKKCRWTSTRLSFLPVKFSSVSPNLLSKLFTPSLSCNVLYPGKLFHSNSIGSPSILSRFPYCGDVLNHRNLSSHASFDWSMFENLTKTQNRVWKDVDLLCVEDW